MRAPNASNAPSPAGLSADQRDRRDDRDSLKADVAAPGQHFDALRAGLLESRGTIEVVEADTGRTHRHAVFAGGDIVTGGETVIGAMGAGKRSAKAIHEYLMQEPGAATETVDVEKEELECSPDRASR